MYKSNCEDFPNCEYIGQTKRSFKDRLAEHRDYLKMDVLTKPSGEHFTKSGHNVAHLKGLVLENLDMGWFYLFKILDMDCLFKIEGLRFLIWVACLRFLIWVA